MKCPHCDRDFTPVEEQKFCPFCGEKVEPHQQFGDADRTDESRHESERTPWDTSPPLVRIDDSYCPWEDQETLGFFRGIGQTLTQSTLMPRYFFEQLPLTGGLVAPLLYALIIQTTGALAVLVWLYLLDSPLLNKIHGDIAVATGIALLVGVFLSIPAKAAVLHTSLFLTGGATKNFEATFRVTCYSTGPELFKIVPIIGEPLSIAWQLGLWVIGLRTVHEISTGRAVLAVSLPAILCCGVLFYVTIQVIRSLGLAPA